MPVSAALGAAIAKILADASGAFAGDNPFQQALAGGLSNATGGLVKATAFNSQQRQLSSNILSIINKGVEPVTSEPLREAGQGVDVFPGGKTLGDIGLTDPTRIDPFQALALGQQGTEDLIRTNQQERMRVEKALGAENDFAQRLKVEKLRADNAKTLQQLRFDQEIAEDQRRKGPELRDLQLDRLEGDLDATPTTEDRLKKAKLDLQLDEMALKRGQSVLDLSGTSEEAKAARTAALEGSKAAARSANASADATTASTARQPLPNEAAFDRGLGREGLQASTASTQAQTRGREADLRDRPSGAEAQEATDLALQRQRAQVAVDETTAEFAQETALAKLDKAQREAIIPPTQLRTIQGTAINQVRPGILKVMREKYGKDSEKFADAVAFLNSFNDEDLDEAGRRTNFAALWSLLDPEQERFFRGQIAAAEDKLQQGFLASHAVQFGDLSGLIDNITTEALDESLDANTLLNQRR